MSDDVHVEASIHVHGSADDEKHGGSIHIRRVRGKDLVALSAWGSGSYGHGPVQVNPRKLRDALDKLVSEDLGK